MGASGITVYLLVSACLFAFGLIAALSRKNAIGIFMGVELILNAAGLNFVAFQRFQVQAAESRWLDGQVFSLFIIVLAAIEAAVALAIVLRVFQSRKTINPDRLRELRG